MKKNAFMATFFLWALCGFAWAQDQDAPKTWDENATAESLGLEPLTLPADFYPLYPWDHLPAKYQPIDVAIASMAECGFTMPGFVSANEKALCETHGLKYMTHIDVNREKLPTLTEEEADRLIQNAVAATKNDPNLIGYYLIDEPGAGLFPGLAKLVAAIKKHAPGKLAYINLFPSYATTIGSDRESQLQTHSFTEYLERFVQEVKPQVISYDNYMVEYSEDMTHLERSSIYYRDLVEVRRVAEKYGLPWWNIVSSLCIQDESSPPSPARTAFQAYTSLAAGANGLGWFLYYPLGWSYAPIDKEGRKTLTWTYQRAVNEQTRTLGAYLNNYDSTALWFSEPAPAMPNGEKLPTNPGDVVASVDLAWSKMGKNLTETPQILVGQFKAKDSSHDAVMVVNLNFGRSVKADLKPVAEGKSITAISPVDGQPEEMPKNGWWILPGHGRLFLLK